MEDVVVYSGMLRSHRERHPLRRGPVIVITALLLLAFLTVGAASALLLTAHHAILCGRHAVVGPAVEMEDFLTWDFFCIGRRPSARRLWEVYVFGHHFAAYRIVRPDLVRAYAPR